MDRVAGIRERLARPACESWRSNTKHLIYEDIPWLLAQLEPEWTETADELPPVDTLLWGDWGDQMSVVGYTGEVWIDIEDTYRAVPPPIRWTLVYIPGRKA